MIQMNGTYGKAEVMIDVVEQECLDQIQGFLNHPAFTEHIAIMPDCHGGKGSVIGFTMPATNNICPNVIGVDIGCGIISWPIEVTMDFAAIDKAIRGKVPLGFNIHQTPVKRMETDYPYTDAQADVTEFIKVFNTKFGTTYDAPEINFKWYQDLCAKLGVDPKQVDRSIGTLGGGNHFIEIGEYTGTKMNGMNHALSVHSGSRNFGLKVANYYQKLAQGKPHNAGLNRDMAYLTGADAVEYLTAMVFVQHFARLNRETMGHSIMGVCNMVHASPVESIHNYIDFRDMIIRKGAIRSYKGEEMVIPFNMRDGILLCYGKSNADWNCSAPHGAGRVMSRTKAKKSINLDTVKAQMHGIFTTSVNTSTLDEAPDAYKPKELITEAINPTAVIVGTIKTLYNLKAGED